MNVKYLITIAIAVLLASCRRSDNKSIEATDSLKERAAKLKISNEKKVKGQNADSIAFDRILQDAIKAAAQNGGDNTFSKKYEVVSEADGSPVVGVEVNLDYHFTKALPHLIVRRKDPATVYIDVFSKKDGKFIKVLSHEQWSMEYTNDSIGDINGDGRKDLVVNWYGSTGCCLKAFSDVYLLRPDNQTFAKNLEFINPTFSPKEGIVRGICYGHPGETKMYKYKWNGVQVDTLEYVSYQINDEGKKTGKVVLSNLESYSRNYKVIKVLAAVPKEYRRIGGYDWFTGKCCK